MNGFIKKYGPAIVLTVILIIVGIGCLEPAAKVEQPVIVTTKPIVSFTGFGLPANSDVKVLDKGAFQIGYSEGKKNPLWVTYCAIEKKYDGTRPKVKFKIDKETEAKVSHNDYTNSGFDRGHMAPSYGIMAGYGKDAQLKTFYMSNICPQKPDLNQGCWKKLEEMVSSEFVSLYKKVWVFTGPIFDNDKTFVMSNKTQVITNIEIPDGFYKILAAYNDDRVKVIAFIYSQSSARNEKPDSHIVSVDEIEKLTGINFLEKLPDIIEDKIESIRATDINNWRACCINN
ncbi:MAG: DNA/RNA non-specific endonuclease [Phycisphaerae bacterium]|nr:DNA/RNA non-specific endonuclease [Phycisphaerae bacterium]